MGNWPTEPPTIGTNGQPTVFNYIPYHVYFRDPADCAAIRAQYGGYGVLEAPANLRDDLGILETAFGWNLDAATRWIHFPIWSKQVVDRSTVDGDWLSFVPVRGTYVYPPNPSFPGDPFWWPPLSHVFDYDQDWFTVPFSPSVPVWGEGRDLNYIWAAMFLSAGGHAVPPGLDPIRPRRFFTGFETYGGQEIGVGEAIEGHFGTDGGEIPSRVASRTPDGLGLAIRNQSSSANMRLDQYSAVVNGVNSWERVYIRVRTYPTATTVFWIFSADTANSAMKVGLTSGGNVTIHSEDNFANQSVRATSAGVLALDTWYRLDAYVIFKPRRVTGAVVPCEVAGASNGNQGFVELYVNGASFVNGNGQCHVGFGVRTLFCDDSQISAGEGAGANGLGIDVDDWSNMDPGPCTTATAAQVSNTIDWLMGHHAQMVPATGFGAGHNAGWSSNYRVALQSPSARAALTGLSVNAITLASARYEIDTEMDGDILGPLSTLRQQGALALIAGVVNDPSDSGTNGRVGYTLAGGADVTRTIAEGSAMDGQGHLANISSGSTEPPDMSTYEPVQALHINATDITTNSISQACVVAQFLGSWDYMDNSDDADAPGLPAMQSLHNAPYITAPWARAAPAHVNAVGVATGTYVGNGATGQDIALQLPAVHWLLIRNTSNDDVTWWWTGMHGPHYQQSAFEILPNNMVRMQMQADGTVLMQLTGNHVGGNASGTTYQYIALCDPMSRIMINGAIHWTSGTPTNALLDSAFTPTFAFFVRENTENSGGSTDILTKGPAHAANDGTRLDGTLGTSVATFGTGSFISRSSLHGTVISQVAFSMFRQGDAALGLPVVVIASYTGNGAGNRTIAVDLQGRRPAYCLIQPNNAAAYHRDPSHTSTNSSRADGGITSTDRIRGGNPDQILVGTNFNLAGVGYNVFVIPSCQFGGTGWGTNETCGLTPPGWSPDPDDPNYWPTWVLDPPPEPPPPLVGPGCLVTFGSGSDSGGGAGCNDDLGSGTDSGGGSGCPSTLQKDGEEAA